MNVTTHWTNRPEQPLTAPFPQANGVFVAIRSGNFYSPDSWNPLEVRNYCRGNVRYRPFFSVRWGRFGFYVGWKAYGVDTDNQRMMPGISPADVYPGSVAIQGFTFRASRGVAP